MESQHQGYGPDQMFCLRWSNHQTNMLNVFNQLRYNESFVDVTLAVDGRVLKAHKMVLSACSPYFQKMFEMTPDKHPVVFIDRVHYQDMKRLLEFMYRGEVSIDQETLNRFLKVARSLRIRGLTEIEEPGGFSGGFSPSLGPMDDATRQRLAEQMAAAALAEFRPPHRTSVEVAPPSGAARRPASCPAEEETPRKASRMEREPGRDRDQERPRDRQNSREPGREPESKRESMQVNGMSSKETSSRVDTNSTASPAHPAAGLLMAKTEPEAAEPAGLGAPPPSPTGLKHERADVFCQPDIWISEGIYVAGHQQAAPAAAGHAAAREPPPSPPPGLEDTPMSPEDPASLLDYVTHEDGSVTCKLCGEQVPSRNHWYRHKYRTHAWHTYKCEDCGITYKSKRGFEAHLEAKHDRRADRSDREPARRRDWEGVARALEDTRKQKEEELVSDIINRVKRECAMEGEDYTRRGYVKHF